MKEAIDGEMKELIAEKMRYLRIAGKITLMELSAKSGIALSHLSMLERGRKRITGKTYNRYLDALKELSEQKKNENILEEQEVIKNE